MHLFPITLKPGLSGQLFAACILFSSLTWLQAGKDWPEFRGPTGQGLSSATNVPLHWSASSNVLWKTPIPGGGWSSPVLAGGRIYLTTATTNGATSLRALRLNAATGQVEWNVELFVPTADATQAIHKKNSLASPTPIVHEDRLYVHFGHMGTAALDLEGKVLWRQSEVKYSPMHGNSSSPILLEGALVFHCDGKQDPFIVALDADTGAVRWKTPRSSTATRKFSNSTPLAINTGGITQIISTTSGYVGSYDPADGRELWRVHYPEGYSLIARPVFAHGLIFISSCYTRPLLYAINPSGASGDVTDSHVVWKHSRGVPKAPSPLVVGDELYFVSDAGVATCVDARTGAVHWNERIGGDFSASPVFAGGRVYFQNETGQGAVIRAGKEFEVLARNDLGERTLASPALADNAIIIRSEYHLWRIGK